MHINSEEEILKSIVKKINNRCNPENYNSFSELYEKVKTTSFNNSSSFLTKEELEFIKSDIKIENSILKLCIKHRKKEAEDDRVFTINDILDMILLTDTSLIVYDERCKKYENVEMSNNFLKDPSSKSIHGTIEELLVMLDLSVIPYR